LKGKLKTRKRLDKVTQGDGKRGNERSTKAKFRMTVIQGPTQSKRGKIRGHGLLVCKKCFGRGVRGDPKTENTTVLNPRGENSTGGEKEEIASKG